MALWSYTIVRLPEKLESCTLCYKWWMGKGQLTGKLVSCPWLANGPCAVWHAQLNIIMVGSPSINDLDINLHL